MSSRSRFPALIVDMDVAGDDANLSRHPSPPPYSQHKDGLPALGLGDQALFLTEAKVKVDDQRKAEVAQATKFMTERLILDTPRSYKQTMLETDSENRRRFKHSQLPLNVRLQAIRKKQTKSASNRQVLQQQCQAVDARLRRRRGSAFKKNGRKLVRQKRRVRDNLVIQASEDRRHNWLLARGMLGEHIQKQESDKRLLRQWFNSLDTNLSGSISAAELMDPLLATGLVSHLGEVNEMIATIDVNNDGEIDFQELLQLYECPHSVLAEKHREAGVNAQEQIAKAMRCAATIKTMLMSLQSTLDGFKTNSEQDKFAKHMAINVVRRRCLMDTVLVDRTGLHLSGGDKEKKREMAKRLKHIETFFEQKDKAEEEIKQRSLGKFRGAAKNIRNIARMTTLNTDNNPLTFTFNIQKFQTTPKSASIKPATPPAGSVLNMVTRSAQKQLVPKPPAKPATTLDI